MIFIRVHRADNTGVTGCTGARWKFAARSRYGVALALNTTFEHSNIAESESRYDETYFPRIGVPRM